MTGPHAGAMGNNGLQRADVRPCTSRMPVHAGVLACAMATHLTQRHALQLPGCFGVPMGAGKSHAQAACVPSVAFAWHSMRRLPALLPCINSREAARAGAIGLHSALHAVSQCYEPCYGIAAARQDEPTGPCVRVQ